MMNNDPAKSAEIAQRIINTALQNATAKEVWASHEEIALTAQSGIQAIPEADRDRVLRAIAANSDGAAAVFDLARIPASELLGNPGSEIPPIAEPLNIRGRRRLYQLAMPAWGLAASVMLVSGVGLLLESNKVPPSDIPSFPKNLESTQSEAVKRPIEHPDSVPGTDSTLLAMAFLIALLAALVLAPFAWKRFRNTTK